MKIRESVLTVFLAVALWGCGGEEVIQQVSVEKRFAVAMKLFEDEDYTEALEEFKIITLQFQGSKLSDDAQYYMGECHYRREQFVLAAYEYDLLIRTMPTSEYVARGRYRRSMCYYNLSPESYRDQDYTKKAIDEFQAFLEYNPTDTLASDAEAKIAELNAKLAKKEYDNGIIYLKMEYYKAATVYFDRVLEKFHDTQYAEPSLLKKAEALYSRKRYLEAQVEIEKFLEKYPATELRSDALKLKEDIKAGMLEKDPKAVQGVQQPSAENISKPKGS